MNKLLSAEFARLWKSLIFKLGLLFSVGFGIFAVFMRWMDVKNHPDVYEQLSVEYSNADGLIFLGGLYLVFAAAVFISIFVGTEYSDGTIRNKLAVGHTRSSIYFSKLIVCAAADGIMHISYILVVLVLGNLLIDGTTMKVTELLSFTMVSIMAVLALTALLVLFSMLIQSKAAGAVVCLLTVLIMFFASVVIRQKLDEPEYYNAYSYEDENTSELVMVEEKNYNYLTGGKREFYEFLDNFLPVSQLYQIIQNISDNLSLIVTYDCIIILVTTGVGVFVFRKKNLK